MSVCVEKIEIDTKGRRTIEEPVAVEGPVNIFLNGSYVVTLLATPILKEELALGWVFDEGLLHSLEEVEDIVLEEDAVDIKTNKPLGEELLQLTGVSRLYTTACGLSANKFYKIISGKEWRLVRSGHKVKASEIVVMAKKLEYGTLFQSTGGTHVAALFEEGKMVALAEDVGRHNAVDKVVGAGLKTGVNFSNSVLISSGRQPADMVLKAARMEIPIVISTAAPIRSGVIAAEKTGVTLVCFVRERRMNVYTHSYRILMS